MGTDTSKTNVQSVGNYDLVEKIAEGGMGTVYKGRNRETGDIVAIKIVSSSVANNPVLLQRFENEFNVARKLDHPNIVRALDYGHMGSTPYLVMEFVDGESLGQKLERDGAIPVDDAIKLIAQVAQGLHRAHKVGMIHRDVKPDNIMVTRDGQAKLTDLGLVKDTESDMNLTRTGRGLGTPHFMAPEQFKSAKNADARCDIYSLGATLYQMVTGELPFRSSGPLDSFMKKMNNDLKPPREIVSSIPERVDWAIRRAMSAKAEMRPETCREFVEDLTGRSTRKMALQEPGAAPGDIWYLVYVDEGTGETKTVKGTTAAIRTSLKEGVMGDASNVRASRTKDADKLEPLRNYPEFRDLVIEPAPLNPTPASAIPTTKVPIMGGKSPTATPTRTKELTKVSQSGAASSADAPRIDLGTTPPTPVDWMQWILLAVVVIATAVGAFFLAPWK